MHRIKTKQFCKVVGTNRLVVLLTQVLTPAGCYCVHKISLTRHVYLRSYYNDQNIFCRNWQNFDNVCHLIAQKPHLQFFLNLSWCQGFICLIPFLGHCIHQIFWSIRFVEVTRLLYWLNKTLINTRWFLFRRLSIDENRITELHAKSCR